MLRRVKDEISHGRVSSYGQIIGHLADAQYAFCSIALGEKNPGLRIEETKTTKADLIAALKDAVTYCDRAYDSMTDASGSQVVKFFGIEAPKLGVLSGNSIHSMEHYGNLVTYMRLRTSFRRPANSPPGRRSNNNAPNYFERRHFRYGHRRIVTRPACPALFLSDSLSLPGGLVHAGDLRLGPGFSFAHGKMCWSN
jgi:hypothetical protein